MKKYIKLWRSPSIIAGTTTKLLGDFQKGKNLHKLLKILNITKKKIVFPQQVHGNRIALVKYSDGDKVIPGVDGLITQDPKLVLMVRTADCMPIFFLNKKLKIIGLIHAGWRSSLKEIANKVVDKFKKLGADPSSIELYLGPHICKKCYEIGKDLASEFVKKFKTKKLINQENMKVFLNLAYLNKLQLITEGILEKNIKISPYCTYCDDLFFSYRKILKPSKEFHEMISFITLNEN